MTGPFCAAVDCSAPAIVTYEAGPLTDPYRTASACRRHRAPFRGWVAAGGRVRRTPLAAGRCVALVSPGPMAAVAR